MASRWCFWATSAKSPVPASWDLIEAQDAQIERSVNLTKAIEAPFDQHLLEGVSDADAGRKAVLDAIVALEEQTDTIVSAAQALGITISVS